LADAAGRIETYIAGDSYRWQYRHYETTSPPRARALCIHGIQSHGGWYEHSCNRLREAGFEVFFLDRRGAGLNQQDRGDTPSFRRLLDDIAEFLRTLRGTQHTILPSPPLRKRGVGGEESEQQTPSTQYSVLSTQYSRLPVFLVAISWGGKLAAALQRRHPGLVDGLALLCPGFCPKVGPSLSDRLAILWSRLIGPRRLFPVPLNDPDLFTATPRWQQFIRNDPLSVREATARFFVESARLDGYLRFVPSHVRTPVLLMLAEHDRIIDNARTRRFVERFAATDKEVLCYPEAHHTLEFQPEPDIYVNDLISWIEKHLV
jgi:alpha-beta hydrolase superfamily lysophospholipase